MKPPKREIPDEEWCAAIGSNSAHELIAGKLISEDQFEFAQKIIAQQAFIYLVSNVYPAGDLNPN